RRCRPSRGPCLSGVSSSPRKSATSLHSSSVSAAAGLQARCMRSSESPERPSSSEWSPPGAGAAAEAATSPVVFVFLDPWTLGTGRHGSMIEHMLRQSFTLLDFEFKALSEADAEEIYRTNHPIREGNSWHIARLVYPMGRSLGLLLGLRDPATCACIKMRR